MACACRRAGTRHGPGSRRLALVLGRDGEPVSVGWTRPRAPGDSGYTVILEDAPPAAELTAASLADPAVARWECLRCLPSSYAGLAEALAVARSRGAADRVAGRWVARRADEPARV